MSTELISAIAAIGAAVFSFGSYMVARRALSIEKARDDRRLTPFNCNLIQGLHKSGKGTRALIFLVSLTNNSSVDLSIFKIFLNVIFIDSFGNVKKIKLSHDSIIAQKYGLANYEFADLHPIVRANQTISKGFIFEYDISLLANNTFEKYEVEFVDNRDNKCIIDAIMTMEIIDKKDEEN